MVISDENRSNLVRPTTMQGGLNVGTGKLGQQQVRHTRRALGVINESLVAAQRYPCVVNKRAFREKREFYERKQADPAHRPIKRKFAAQIDSTQQHCPKPETKLPKLPNTSAINSTGFGDCIFIDEECESPEDQADQPEPMFLEQAETVPDEADDTNPLAVVEYAEELYAYYRRMEGFRCVPPNYLEQQFDINEKMRAILIDWLIEVHDMFELLKETLFLTVNLIDRFLSKQTVVRKKLQLVGLVAMLLACKYEEVSVPVVGDLILISDKAYTRKEVLEMENLMLNTLQFNMSVPTPYVFMKRFLKAAQSDKKLELLSFFLMELSLVEYEMLKFPPSLLAAAAVYTAQATLYGFKQWSRTCEWHTSYSEDQLLECSSLMVGFHQKASTGRLRGVHRKYCTSKLKFGSSDDQVGSTQIEQNQRELDRYPAICCRFESKLVDGGSSPIVQTNVSSLLRTEETARPIFEDYKRIRSNLSDDFDCRMLEHNPYEWQFGIRGASGTEFEGGIYHGRIQFPEEYPSKPPSFTLLTENGRFKTHTKIRIRRLNDWQPSWGVRDALDALIDEMPTYPDDELGSVEYNKEERRDLAMKSRAAAPKYERQKLIDGIHNYLLSKSPPVPVTQLPQLSPSQASNSTGGGSIVVKGGGYVVNVSGNTFHATNANGVGIFDSMNAFPDEGHKLLPSWLKIFSWRKQN